MIVLQTRGLEKVYGTGEARVRALDGVDLASAVDSTPCKLTHGENISFAVERDGGVVRLTAQAAQ